MLSGSKGRHKHPTSGTPARLVGSTWTYKIKRDDKGEITRYKSRLCAQGFTQTYGYDFESTYANTVKMDTIRLLLCIAAKHGLILWSADFSTAYLNGIIKEDILMKQAPGFEIKGPNGEQLFCKLRKGIYGLRQSAQVWEDTLAQVLIGMGFTRCEADPCLYKIYKDNDVLYLTIYVDDLAIASSTDDMRIDLLKNLGKHFDIKDCGQLTWFLNTSISQNIEKRMVHMHQQLYIEELASSLGVIEGSTKRRTVPCTPEILELPRPDPEAAKIDPRYRSIVGKIGWLVTMTRPDIAYAHSILSRYNNCGGEQHMTEAIKLVQYLLRTKHYRLTFSQERAESLRQFLSRHSGVPADTLPDYIFGTDTSHGGERPMAGYFATIYGDPWGWKGYRLDGTPLSSCEGEYRGCTKATTLIMWFRILYKFFGESVDVPAMLFCDNKGAVMLADNDTTSKRMKHIATRIAFLREQVKAGHVQLHHIPAEGQLADIFTKPLATSLFHTMRIHLIA